jgi:hypothetical protein
MSYNSLAQQTKDEVLLGRIKSAANQEARNNPNVAGTPAADRIINNGIGALDVFTWPVCLNTEQEYASALAADNPNPGGDEAVISDGMILSAVQASWPQT